MSRYSGWLLVATGLIHCLIGLLAGGDVLAQMHNQGWWDSAQPTNGDFAPFAMLWFQCCGFFWIVLGLLMQHCLRVTGLPLPAWLGWSLLGSGALIAFLLPASGAWLLLPQGWLIHRAAKRCSPEAG